MNPETPPAFGGGDLPPAGPPAEDRGQPAPLPPARRPHRAAWAVLAVVVAGLMAGSALGGLAFGRNLAGQSAGNLSPSQLAPRIQNPISSLPAIPLPPAQNGSLSQQQIADKVTPAVVDVNTTLGGAPNGRTAQAAGTGMILTSSGQVLTNHHVVQGATSISVDIPNHSGSYKAHVLGIDPAADVALIQIEGVSGLPTVTMADSSRVSVGQSVVAIGNRLGQGGSAVTSGSITALDQSITAYDGQTSEQLSGLIQMDAPISPGDSGGPLVNSAGQVIGMITAGSTGRFRQPSTTTGFAVPSSTALDVVNQIRSGHASSDIIVGASGFIGVGVRDLDQATGQQLGISSGVVVTGVNSGSPAEKAGITQGSVITAINGTTAANTTALGVLIHAHKPGDSIQVTWVDQSGTHRATVTLTSGPVA